MGEWTVAAARDGGTIVKHAVIMGGRTLTVTMDGLDPEVARLVPLRIDCYLRPNIDRMLSGFETALGVTLPDRLSVRFTGSRKLVRTPADWHMYLPDGDRSGVRTVERILIQLAAGTGAWTGDVADLHAVTCPLVEERIDLTFICALELL
jgi:hypothetical protein